MMKPQSPPWVTIAFVSGIAYFTWRVCALLWLDTVFVVSEAEHDLVQRLCVLRDAEALLADAL